MDAINAHDWLHLGVSVAAAIVTIVSLRVDVRWLRKWCDDHQQRDEQAFADLRDDIREVRAAQRKES